MKPRTQTDAADDASRGDGSERVGPYSLVRLLGRGGMAEAFEAVRRGDGGVEQRVCLKRTLPALEQDPEFLALFLREAKVSATLRHVNVASVLDFGESGGRHFLVLELVDGVDLRRLLKHAARAPRPRSAATRDRPGLPPDLITLLSVELASALDYAHAARPDGRVEGVVHRDVSPSNVLLGTHGEVKLADFGVAKAVDSPRLTRTGGIKGKIPYMAPEYARGGDYDARSDLFSLGVLLYEAAAGHRPFDGRTDVETLERAHSGEHALLSEVAPGLPEALVDAIESLIAREPSARPPTAAALLDRLPTVNPRARLELGAWVRAAREHDADSEQLGREATMRASEGGTAIADDRARVAPWVVDSAPADLVTRTRVRPDGPPAEGSATEFDADEAEGAADDESTAPGRPMAHRGPDSTRTAEDQTVTRAPHRAAPRDPGSSRTTPDDVSRELASPSEANPRGTRDGGGAVWRAGAWALAVAVALGALWALSR